MVINGGELNIYGGSDSDWGGGGAGIGGGGARYNLNGGNGGAVTINGGTVNVTAGAGNDFNKTKSGHAIGGGGNASSGCGTSGAITITGGSLTAISNGDNNSIVSALAAAPDTDSLSSDYVISAGIDVSGSGAAEYVQANNDSYHWFRAAIPSAHPAQPQGSSDTGSSQSHEGASEGSGSAHAASVNPDALIWEYLAAQADSKAVKDKQGPLCVMAFKAAMPDGFSEAFSFNLLIKGQKSYDVKNSEFVLNIPKAYQKEGRIFRLTGIDAKGNTCVLMDTDDSDATITVSLKNYSGYAFDLIFMDSEGTADDPGSAEGTVSGNDFYTVKKGDTLYGIARKFMKNVVSLVGRNGIKDPGLIMPGQKIYY